MIFMKTLVDLRLRREAGVTKETIGEIREGSITYIVGGPRQSDNMIWMELVGYIQDGSWHQGWASIGMNEVDRFLIGYEPAKLYGSPLLAKTRISQMFGENPITYSNLGYVGHNGVDYATPIGQPVFSIDDGVASHVRFDPNGYGHYVRIDHHDGAVSIYAHLFRTILNEGQQVTRGQMIGECGNSGWSSGPHLHFELRVPPINQNNGYGGRVDPFAHIDRQFSVLPNYIPGDLQVEWVR